MEIGVPSRFACLHIEDEDLSSMQSKPKEIKKKVKKPTVPEPPSKTTNNKKSDKNPPAVKKPAPKPDTTKQATAPNKKSKKKQVQQFEDWKQKDEELENGHYEEDLRNAILLSKLDFEHNKEMYAALMEAAKQDSKNKKSKKNKTVSLDKFLNENSEKQPTNNHVNFNKTDVKNCDFFNSVEIEAKSEIKKEQVNAKRKKREANINEVISLAQYQEKYETEHRLRLAAEQELKHTKAELESADKKVKAFCNLISQGQMKDKTALLIENQHLNAVKNDLTDSVTNLHALLEKERSKLASLTSSLQNNNKQKDKKRKGN